MWEASKPRAPLHCYACCCISVSAFLPQLVPFPWNPVPLACLEADVFPGTWEEVWGEPVTLPVHQPSKPFAKLCSKHPIVLLFHMSE